MLMLSDAVRNKLLGSESLEDIFADSVIKIFTGYPPSNANAAETGELLVTITRDGKTTATKQKMSISVTPVNNSYYTLILNGIEIKYLSGSSATVDDITAGIANALNLAQGNEVNGVVINNPKLFDKFIITDVSNGSGEVTIEAKNLNERFTLEVGNNINISTLEENYYGLHFNSNAIDGTIYKDDTELWTGKCLKNGTAGYFRLQKANDDGSENPDAVRLQGTVGTSNADMIVTSTQFHKDAMQTISSLSVSMPAS